MKRAIYLTIPPRFTSNELMKIRDEAIKSNTLGTGYNKVIEKDYRVMQRALTIMKNKLHPDLFSEATKYPGHRIEIEEYEKIVISSNDHETKNKVLFESAWIF